MTQAYRSVDNVSEPQAGRTRLQNMIGAGIAASSLDPSLAPHVNGQFRIKRIIGVGGFGVVCQAVQVVIDREVALKLFAVSDDGGSDEVKHMLREARTLARLDHPGIVGVHSAAEGTLCSARQSLRCAYIEMPFVRGDSLRSWIERAKPTGTSRVDLLMQVGEALCYAHEQGVLHRDLKPENIMVDESGRAQVIDLGLALVGQRELSEREQGSWNDTSDALGTRMTVAGQVRGTAGYMAPEALRGKPQGASDQYSFAIVCWETLTGTHPEQEAEATTQASRQQPVGRGGTEKVDATQDVVAAVSPPTSSALSPAVRAVLRRALDPFPSERYPSMRAFVTAFLHAHVEAASAGEASAVAEAAASYETSVSADRSDAFARGSLKVYAWGIGAVLTAALSAYLILPALISRDSYESGPDQMPRGQRGVERNDSPIPVAPESLAALVPACETLTPWSGAWMVTSSVEWSEFASHYDFAGNYELKLEIDAKCSVDVGLTKIYEESAGRHDAVLTVGRTKVRRSPDGHHWVEFEANFPTAPKVYRDGLVYKEERVDFALELTTTGSGTEVLAGDLIRLVRETGTESRTMAAILRGGRGAFPAPSDVISLRRSCESECRTECAGEKAFRGCVATGCVSYYVAYDGLSVARDRCGPPSPDFVPPFRTRQEQAAIRAGGRFGAARTDVSRSDKATQAQRNAERLRGQWWLWAGALDATGTGPERPLLLSLNATQGTALMGTLRAHGRDGEIAAVEAPVTVEVTPEGAWSIDVPADFAGLGLKSPLVLAGAGATNEGGRAAVSFGIDATENRPVLLRATRKDGAPR